jgi:hypothetical protein
MGAAGSRVTIRGDGSVEQAEGTQVKSQPMVDKADLAKLVSALLEEGVWQQQSAREPTSGVGSGEVLTISYGDYSVRLTAPPQGTETPAFRSLREFIAQIGNRVRR